MLGLVRGCMHACTHARTHATAVGNVGTHNGTDRTVPLGLALKEQSMWALETAHKSAPLGTHRYEGSLGSASE
jgi:hypothetical protein